MKKTTSFVVGFCTVLIAGIAVAQVGSPLPGASEAPPPRDTPLEKPTASAEVAVQPAPESHEFTKKSEDKSAAVESAKKETKTDVAKKVDPEISVKDTTPPELVILKPANGTVVAEKTVAFSGETEPGAKVTAGEHKAEVGADGHWKITLNVNQGKTTVTFKAHDAAGNVSSASVTVVYEVSAPKVVEFSANQKYGENADSYDKFWGTGSPGTKITGTSKYGSASTEASDGGEWDMKIWFEAPVGVTFPVTISDAAGHSKTFNFTRVEAVHEFWAAQKYGSCSEDPPYDVFYGEGKPGTVIEIFSDYGSGRTEIGDGGGWDLKVVFDTAPVGKTFEVILETSEGHRKVFTFTKVGAEIH